MRRIWGILLVLILSWAFALQTGRPLAYSLAYLVTAVVVLSYLWALSNITWVQVGRYTRGRRSQVGKLTEEQFEVSNRSFLPKLWLEVRDYSTLPGHDVSRVMNTLGGKKRQRWMTRTLCQQRGRFRLGPMTLTSGDPLGLFRLQRELPATANIIVYPATVDLAAFAPSAGYLPGGESMRRRTHYITTNVAGVRNYAPGDSFSRIHWRTTARTGELMVKEFELDPTADVWLFLDMDSTMHLAAPWQPESERRGPAMLWRERERLELIPSTEEYAVTAAASLANHLLTHEQAVGLIAHGRERELIHADRGERQLNKILETLAVIEARGHIPISQVIAAEGRHLSRNTVVIVITPSTALNWVASLRDLRRRGVQGAAVLVAASTFGAADPWQAVQAELIASSIVTYVVQRDDDLGAALTRRAGTARAFR
ncbi:MAG TPA: DUF58 domain-containing protein [Anaerolineae bacterium]|nr:DUF58 domain-containing protein [Anaerolineae bacterium]